MNNHLTGNDEALPIIAPELIETAEFIGERLAYVKTMARAQRQAEFRELIESSHRKSSGDDSMDDYCDFGDAFKPIVENYEKPIGDIKKPDDSDSDTESSRLTVSLYSQEQVAEQDRLPGFKDDNNVSSWLEKLENSKLQYAQLYTVNCEQVATLRNLREAFPNMHEVCDVLIGAAVLAEKSGLPLQLPNLLIDGPPGCGKTSLVRQIAKIINIPLITIPLGSLDGRFELAGGHRTYRSSEPSLLIQRLLQHNIANSIFLFDEVELARPELYQPLYAFLEDKNFRDHYLQIDFNISHVNIIFISNDKSALPPALRSRVMEFDIDEPTQQQRELIIERLYETMLCENAAFNAFPKKLPRMVINKLTSYSLRQARILLETALLRSAAAATNHGEPLQLDPDLLSTTPTARKPIGFVH